MTQHTTVNKAGMRLIQLAEGLSLVAYKCPAGIWTRGYGHTGTDVKAGLMISEAHAEELLLDDVQEAKDAVNRLARVSLTHNQFSALVSFVYNVGEGAFRSSTLLRKLNAGDYLGAAEQLLRWNKAGGVVLGGLTARRKAEKALFES
jgi:lysozyme